MKSPKPNPRELRNSLQRVGMETAPLANVTRAVRMMCRDFRPKVEMLVPGALHNIAQKKRRPQKWSDCRFETGREFHCVDHGQTSDEAIEAKKHVDDIWEKHLLPFFHRLLLTVSNSEVYCAALNSERNAFQNTIHTNFDQQIEDMTRTYQRVGQKKEGVASAQSRIALWKEWTRPRHALSKVRWRLVDAVDSSVDIHGEGVTVKNGTGKSTRKIERLYNQKCSSAMVEYGRFVDGTRREVEFCKAECKPLLPQAASRSQQELERSEFVLKSIWDGFWAVCIYEDDNKNVNEDEV